MRPLDRVQVCVRRHRTIPLAPALHMQREKLYLPTRSFEGKPPTEVYMHQLEAVRPLLIRLEAVVAASPGSGPGKFPSRVADVFRGRVRARWQEGSNPPGRAYCAAQKGDAPCHTAVASSGKYC